ncbi:phosphatidylinositol-specific phospholipase C1-like protein [Kribbella sp. CA-293567]|uniref:phosphatidylinositol-specific phospholipase C1-like protein n=1 Tax=Kribbella sp. CA-293567 TaxID=3002436 RepID=UPI0022DE28F3|nr:phosphatidylinositol-specific phospholipase C1-like protein [Kribbella sp. CA-293567]WBQ04660.1 phosphatidylinositol-specific phospholipase C1-like protein [Kribbella sp. CA-293567]
MQLSRKLVAGLASVAVAGGGLAGSAALPGDAAAKTSGGAVRMNQLQQIGSHNSYHRELSPNEQKAQQQLNPGSVDLWYSHASIPQQLTDQNVRTLELDLFPDPAGGLYTYPLIRKLTGQGPLTDPALAQPGIKVMHVADFDYNTNCRTFVLCLRQVKAWSDQHPDAAPITINLELKQSDPQVVAAGGVKAPPWDLANLNSVDAEIRSVFGEDDLLSPDDVRKPGLTLEQSVLTKGWPTLKQARGKVLFYFDNGGPGQVRDLYREGKPNLEGRAVFTRGPEGEADAAITQVNDPRGANQAEIRRLVKKGYLVRTRSDEPLSTIRANETSRVGVALASGAQYVTTDFPVAGMASRYDSDFVADLPGPFAVRFNPVSGPLGQRGAVAER